MRVNNLWNGCKPSAWILALRTLWTLSWTLTSSTWSTWWGRCFWFWFFCHSVQKDKSYGFVDNHKTSPIRAWWSGESWVWSIKKLVQCRNLKFASLTTRDRIRRIRRQQLHKKHHGMKKCLFYPCLTHQTSLYVEYRRVESVFLKCVLYQVPRIMVPLSTPELLHPMPLAVMPTTAMSSVLNTMPYTQMELRPSPALISCLSHGKGYSGAKVAETTEHTVAAEEPDNITITTTTEQRSQETENIDNILDDSSTTGCPISQTSLCFC